MNLLKFLSIFVLLVNTIDDHVLSVYGLRSSKFSLEDGIDQPSYFSNIDRVHKRQRFRFPDSSEEYSHENERQKDNDDYRSYTVGAHYQVSHQQQHSPSSTYYDHRIDHDDNDRKSSNRYSNYQPNQKPSVSYTNIQFSSSHPKYDHNRSYSPVTSVVNHRQYQPKSKNSKRTYKLSRPEPIIGSGSSSELAKYENLDNLNDQTDEDDFIPLLGNNFRPYQSASSSSSRKSKNNKNSKLKNPSELYLDEREFKGVASKGQIEKYLDDQSKLIDKFIQLQLLNDPSPNARGKYHEFLKSKDDERIEKEAEEEERSRKSTKKRSRNESSLSRYHQLVPVPLFSSIEDDNKKSVNKPLKRRQSPTPSTSSALRSDQGQRSHRQPSKVDSTYSFKVDI